MSSPVTPARPATIEAEKAARAVINRYVREGLMDRRNGNQVLKFALPVLPRVLADMRLNGWAPEEITAHFQAKRAQATNPNGQAAAEVYLAMWAGLQVDYAKQVNAQQGLS